MDLLNGETMGAIGKQRGLSRNAIYSRIMGLRDLLLDALFANAKKIPMTPADEQNYRLLSTLLQEHVLTSPTLLQQREFIVQQMRKIEITSDTLGRPLSANTFASGQNTGLRPLAQGELNFA